MRLRLAAFVLLLSLSYYAVVAFAPHWLSPSLWGLPLSLLLVLGMFATGATLCLFYAFAPTQRGSEGKKAPP